MKGLSVGLAITIAAILIGIGVFKGEAEDAMEQVKLMKEKGFTTFGGPMEWTYHDYENLDTKYVALHDYFKWLKFGYGRACDQASIDIRNGRMTVAQAQLMVSKYDGKLPTKYLKDFLNDMDMSMAEFNKMCEKYSSHLGITTHKNR